jgi:hypothetical protein
VIEVGLMRQTDRPEVIPWRFFYGRLARFLLVANLLILHI